jgi:hypothetical protein
MSPFARSRALLAEKVHVLRSKGLLSALGLELGVEAADAGTFSQSNDLAQRGPVDFGRRIARTLLESDGQSKI